MLIATELKTYCNSIGLTLYTKEYDPYSFDISQNTP